MKKRLLAMVLAVVMVLAVAPIPAGAASISESEVTQRLNALIDGSAQAGKYMPGKTNPVSGECFGFAVSVFNYVFGTSLQAKGYPNAQLTSQAELAKLTVVKHLGTNSTSSSYSKADLVALLKLAKRGDMLLIADPGKSYGHAMIIWSVDQSGTPTVYDANASTENNKYGGTNKIGRHVYSLVSAMYHNGAATLYRYIDYADGSTTPAKTTITFSGLSVPSSLTIGKDGTLDGYITATNSKINSVTAEVINASTGSVALKSTSAGNFSVYSYGPLSNSKLNTELNLGKLAAGTYYVRYTAGTQDGTSASQNTSSFTVGCNGNHTWGSWTTTKNASCGVTGQRQRVCSRCGEWESETIEALSHDYQKTASMPAYDVFICTHCGDSYRVDTVTWVDIPVGEQDFQSVGVRNFSDHQLSCNLMIASYEDGRLASLFQKPLDLSPGASQYVTTPIPRETGTAVWKVFLLDPETLAPILPNLDY